VCSATSARRSTPSLSVRGVERERREDGPARPFSVSAGLVLEGREGWADWLIVAPTPVRARGTAPARLPPSPPPAAPPTADRTTHRSPPHRPRTATAPPLVLGPCGPSCAPTSGSRASPRFRRLRQGGRSEHSRPPRTCLRSPALAAAVWPLLYLQRPAPLGSKPYEVGRARTMHRYQPDPFQGRGELPVRLTPGHGSSPRSL
jgi:hypothetical protein